LALILSALILSGCSSDTDEATEVVVTDDSIDVTPEGAVDAQFATARNTALAYVSGRYGEQAPPAGLAWTTERTTPEGLVGSESFQYAAEGWVVTVSCPVVAPEAVVCQVAATNQASGFQWEGEVDAAGQVTEALPSAGLPVVAWYGYVVSLPAGSQFDDYLVALPEGAAEIGLSGADAAIEAKIVTLRDKEEPGKYAHFWGTLTCPMLDYGGCELVVTRLRPDGPGPMFDPDPVEGWDGSISAL
jgi:hypothetical protein